MPSAHSIEGSLGLDITPLRKAAREARDVGREIAKALREDMREAARGISEHLGESVHKASDHLREFAAAAGVGLSAAGLAEGIRNVYDLGRELNSLSAQTGISTGKLLVMRQALEDSGEGADSLGAAVNRMQKFLAAAAQGNGVATGTFDRLNLSLASIQQLAPDEQFRAIGAAISAMQDPTERSADAMELFGRGGAKFLDLFGPAGALSAAGISIGKQARLLEENSSTFEAIAVRLGHAGLKLQGFFVGVASRLADTLLPLLDRLDKIDLADTGRKFGDGLIKGAEFVLGAFKNPKAFIGVATDAFVYGIMEGGNVLVATFKTARNYFQDGMLETIGGIGDVLLGTLLKAFEVPIAYLQGGLQKVLSNLPESLGGSGEVDAARKRASEIDAQLRQPGDVVTVRGPTGEPMLQPINRAALTAERAELEKTIQGKSVAEYAADFLKSPLTVATADGNVTADQSIERGKAAMQYGLGRAAQSISKIDVQDVLGAGKYRDRLLAGAAGLAAAGAPVLARAAAPEPLIDPKTGKAPSAEAIAQLQNIYGHASANRMVYGSEIAETMNRPAPVSPGYRAQLIGMFGAIAAGKMLNTSGALPFVSARPNVSAVSGLLPFAYAGGIHTGGLGGIGSAYHAVHRGDAARAKAAATKSAKEPVGIDDGSINKLAKAIGGELDVKD